MPPFEVVFRYRDPQLQVGEKYSYFFYFGLYKNLHVLMFTYTFHTQYQRIDLLMKWI